MSEERLQQLRRLRAAILGRQMDRIGFIWAGHVRIGACLQEGRHRRKAAMCQGDIKCGSAVQITDREIGALPDQFLRSYDTFILKCSQEPPASLLLLLWSHRFYIVAQFGLDKWAKRRSSRHLSANFGGIICRNGKR